MPPFHVGLVVMVNCVWYAERFKIIFPDDIIQNEHVDIPSTLRKVSKTWLYLRKQQNYGDQLFFYFFLKRNQSKYVEWLKTEPT